MAYSIVMTEDLLVKMQIQKFELMYQRIAYSSIGPIKSKNISQLLTILSKLIYSVLNSWFDQGYRLPLNNDTFYWTLNTVKISHGDGYMYIHATPNFEKIDLFMLLKMAMENAGLTFADFYDQVIGTGSNEEADFQDLFTTLFKGPVYGPKTENKIKNKKHKIDAFQIYRDVNRMMQKYNDDKLFHKH